MSEKKNPPLPPRSEEEVVFGDELLVQCGIDGHDTRRQGHRARQVDQRPRHGRDRCAVEVRDVLLEERGPVQQRSTHVAGVIGRHGEIGAVGQSVQ